MCFFLLFWNYVEKFEPKTNGNGSQVCKFWCTIFFLATEVSGEKKFSAPFQIWKASLAPARLLGSLYWNWTLDRCCSTAPYHPPCRFYELYEKPSGLEICVTFQKFSIMLYAFFGTRLTDHGGAGKRPKGFAKFHALQRCPDRYSAKPSIVRLDTIQYG